MRNSCIEDCGVYGWGSNKHGQLAQKNALQTISAPCKIVVPNHILLNETKKNLDSIKEMYGSILIERVFCGSKYSAFQTNTGEFWATGNCADSAKVAVAKANEMSAATPETDPDEEQKLPMISKE